MVPTPTQCSKPDQIKSKFCGFQLLNTFVLIQAPTIPCNWLFPSLSLRALEQLSVPPWPRAYKQEGQSRFQDTELGTQLPLFKSWSHYLLVVTLVQVICLRYDQLHYLWNGNKWDQIKLIDSKGTRTMHGADNAMMLAALRNRKVPLSCSLSTLPLTALSPLWSALGINTPNILSPLPCARLFHHFAHSVPVLRKPFLNSTASPNL